MAYASCDNAECEKESWWLQKPPEEYASGGPKCPECGTTRVSLGEASDPAEPTAEPAQAEPETRPAPAEQQSEDPQALATHHDAVETGANLGELVAGMGASKPEEQADTQGKLLTAAGSTIASLGQSLADRKKQDINRAKNADDTDVAAVQDYIDCPECGTQITELPEPGTQFRCPGCGQLLESQ